MRVMTSLLMAGLILSSSQTAWGAPLKNPELCLEDYCCNMDGCWGIEPAPSCEDVENVCRLSMELEENALNEIAFLRNKASFKTAKLIRREARSAKKAGKKVNVFRKARASRADQKLTNQINTLEMSSPLRDYICLQSDTCQSPIEPVEPGLSADLGADDKAASDQNVSQRRSGPIGGSIDILPIETEISSGGVEAAVSEEDQPVDWSPDVQLR